MEEETCFCSRSCSNAELSREKKTFNQRVSDRIHYILSSYLLKYSKYPFTAAINKWIKRRDLRVFRNKVYLNLSKLKMFHCVCSISMYPTSTSRGTILLHYLAFVPIMHMVIHPRKLRLYTCLTVCCFSVFTVCIHELKFV